MAELPHIHFDRLWALDLGYIEIRHANSWRKDRYGATGMAITHWDRHGYFNELHLSSYRQLEVSLSQPLQAGLKQTMNMETCRLPSFPTSS